MASKPKYPAPGAYMTERGKAYIKKHKKLQRDRYPSDSHARYRGASDEAIKRGDKAMVDAIKKGNEPSL